MAEFVEEPIYTQLARIGKALSNPVRLRLLDLLDHGERTVEALAADAGVPVKNTSAQLQRLREVNLVSMRRDSRHVYYRLGDDVSPFIEHIQGFAERKLADLRDAIADHLGDPEVMRPVDVGELNDRLGDPDVLVLDVRTSSEYAVAHIPGAVSVPYAELRDRLDELPGDAQVVAYCSGPYCVVSPNAVRLLREHGFQARPLDGGYTRWRRREASAR